MKSGVSIVIKIVLIAVVMVAASLLKLVMDAFRSGGAWIPIAVAFVVSAAIWKSGKDSDGGK